MLKYGVLGLLIERRGYGYELAQRLTRRLGAAWQLNPSAIYTALNQLESEELIRGRCRPLREVEDHAASRRPERVVYEATESGIEEFRQWFARPSTRPDPIRSEIQLKVALVGPENVPPLLASIAQEEWIVRRMHEECRRTESGMEAGGLEAQSEEGHWSNTAAALVNAAAAARLEGQLEWMGSVREALQQLSVAQLSGLERSDLRGTATT